MHVIFMAPHFPQYQRQFVRALVSLGVRVTGIGDWPAAHLDNQLKSWLQGGYWQVPTMGDEAAILSAVREIHQRDPADHFLTTIELQMLTTARVREALGIKGQSVDSVLLCRDKYEMKRYLEKHGIPCAKTAIVDKSDDARAFVKEHGFPVILKPRDMAGAFDTHVVRDAEELERIVKEMRIDTEHRFIAVEEFITGPEGFHDTLVCDGEVVFEAISYYFPNVLEAMRTRWISPQIIGTNEMDTPRAKQIRDLGVRTVDALKLPSTGTHMEWFDTPKGFYFSEIAARPAGVRFWDIYCWANEFDLYTEWAKAVVLHKCDPKPSRKYSAGLISLRPSQDGTIRGYTGVEDVRRRCGDWIGEMHLPPAGTPTQPIGNGYMANAYLHVRHPEFAECKAMLDYIGETLKVWAS